MRVSLITVAYNSASTIGDTIESVLKQQYPDIEYIVVDGGSTDGTVDCLKTYEPRFGGRMKWISEPDEGLYDAMNKGIRMASGPIVGVLNSDDFYHRTDTVDRFMQVFEQEPEVQAVYGDGRFVRPENLEKTVRYYSSKSFHPRRFRWGFMPHHQTFFTYKHNFERLGYYQTDYRIAADYELLTRFLYTHRLSYRYIPLDFLTMRMGGRSTASLKSNYVLNKEIVRACRENGIYTNLLMLSLKYFVKVFEFVKTRDR